MNRFTRIAEEDDVIIALRDLQKGEEVDGITLLEDIKQGHKIAAHDMKAGHVLLKYGVSIGVLTSDVKKGEWIHTHNLHTGLGEESAPYVYNHKTYPLPSASNRTWKGFLRKDGSAGIRDDLYIVPLVGCVNLVAEGIKKKFLSSHPDMEGRVHVLSHPYGCSQLGDDASATRNLLAGLAKNPNAGGTLILGLGCENNRMEFFLPALGEFDKDRILYFQSQDQKDEIVYGLEQMDKLYDIVSKDERVELPLSKLVIGLKCGGSDGFSGLTANPLLGMMCDVAGQSGAKIALTEVPEMFGAERDLMNRAVNEEIFNKEVALINNFKAYYAKNNQPCYENPSPGNKDGGITTLEEKSNGCVLKGGHLPVVDVIDASFGQRIVKPGLTLVNGPGNDIVASTNLAAAGAVILFFTTGRGTPFGSVIPTIKVATNHRLAEFKSNWIDFDAEIALDTSFKEATEKLLDLLIEVASGKATKEETNGMEQIALFKTGVTL